MWVQPGLEIVIEIDPDGALDSSLGVARRIPETGRLAVEVRAMPLFDLTVIPFLWSQAPEPSIVDLVEAIAADPENHEMLWHTRTLLPVAEMVVTAHEPVLTSTNNAWALRDQTKGHSGHGGRNGALHGNDGGARHGCQRCGFQSRPIQFFCP